MNALALADDATGALETGARLCQAGLDTCVRFAPGLEWAGAALVADTETRHVPFAQAREKIREIAASARQSGVEHVFKKTDSTLRGPIAAEFRALLETWPALPLVYAPAYPALGRTVRNGKLYVEGLPLGRTAFAADLLNPSGESSIPELLATAGAEIVVVRSAASLRTELSPGRILVCDGQNDAHLEAIAAMLRGASCMVAGTAAMASVWAASLSGGGALAWEPPWARTCLVVNGSLHPGSREQVAISRIPSIAHDPCVDSRQLGMRLTDKLARHRWAALCASPPGLAEPLAVAAHAAQVVAHAVRLAAPDCLAVFGGDTVLAILRELGIDEAEPHAELLPGAPASTISVSGRRMLLVTKAGGFGGPGYLVRIREILEKA